MKLINADCIEAMKAMPDNSVDSIVTDPPYELGFMGKSWDSTGIAFNTDVWREALRVIKPGGHLIAFSGSRTYHRMAVAIEDAGFEIRDQIQWIYGSGFPKSMDVSKQIDKGSGENRARQLRFTAWMRSTGITADVINQATGTNMASHYLTDKSQPAIATADLFDKLRPYLPEVPEEIERLVAERTGIEWTAYKNRPVVGTQTQGKLAVAPGQDNDRSATTLNITAPATDAAKQWQGWGTALKPAHEPIVLARKPFIGTVANNVLTHGTGAINIDATRVGNEVITTLGGRTSPIVGDERIGKALGMYGESESLNAEHTGRWPANVIHDGSEEVTSLFPDTKSGSGQKNKYGKANIYEVGLRDSDKEWQGDSGSAARFFYCAKASKRDRNEGLDGFEARQQDESRKEGNPGGDNPRNRGVHERVNHHPTVKPTSLMQYLVRLVTPPNGTVLDPFMGSGSTGKACAYEGFDFIGIEMNAEYIEIAKARIAYAQNNQSE